MVRLAAFLMGGVLVGGIAGKLLSECYRRTELAKVPPAAGARRTAL